MADFKANGFLSMRKLIKAKGEETEKAFLAQLTPEEQKRYHTMTNISKLPIEEVVKFSKIAASLLFPDLSEKEGLRKLGAAGVDEDMNGALKILLRFVDTKTVIKQSAKVWRNQHSQGKGYVVGAETSTDVEFVVEDYPDLPVDFLHITTGYIAHLAKLSGAKNVQVLPNFLNKNRWSWKIKWDK